MWDSTNTFNSSGLTGGGADFPPKECSHLSFGNYSGSLGLQGADVTPLASLEDGRKFTR